MRRKLSPLEKQAEDQNRATFAPVKKQRGHRFMIPGYRGQLEIYLPYTSFPIFRSMVPMGLMTRGRFDKLCKERRVHWNYWFESYFSRSVLRHIRHMNPIIFVSLDVDLPFEEVQEAIKKWPFAQKYGACVSHSLNGIKSHLHVLVDMSSESYFPNFDNDPTHFKSQDRYKMAVLLRQTLAESFTKHTGLEVDMEALNTDHLCITMSEVSEINAYWGKRRPVNFAVIKPELLEKQEIRTAIEAECNIKEFAAEFRRMLSDPDLVDMIMDYLEEQGIVPAKREYYEQVIRNLKANVATVLRHLGTNTRQFFFLKTKQQGVSIERATVNQKIWGLPDTKKNLTYSRQIAMFVWNLKVSEKYIPCQKTDIFEVVEAEKKYFSNDFLADHWYASSGNALRHVPSQIALSGSMGDGNTFQTISDNVFSMTVRLGPTEASTRLVEAIKNSIANDKRERCHYVRKKVLRIAEKYGVSDPTETQHVPVERQAPEGRGGLGHLAGRISGSGLQFREPTFGRGGGESSLHAPVQYPRRETPSVCSVAPEEGREAPGADEPDAYWGF